MPQGFARTVFNRLTRYAGSSGGLDKDAQQAEPTKYVGHSSAVFCRK